MDLQMVYCTGCACLEVRLWRIVRHVNELIGNGPVVTEDGLVLINDFLHRACKHERLAEKNMSLRARYVSGWSVISSDCYALESRLRDSPAVFRNVFVLVRNDSPIQDYRATLGSSLGSSLACSLAEPSLDIERQRLSFSRYLRHKFTRVSRIGTGVFAIEGEARKRP